MVGDRVAFDGFEAGAAFFDLAFEMRFFRQSDSIKEFNKPRFLDLPLN